MQRGRVMMNRLQYEKSPYLLQHRDNPVDWYAWGEEAFAKAAAEDKPVFLSIGYSTCHWCHVMAHESFEDDAVAARLNADFVCVKVDREERPDVDAVYMAVCQALTGSGGWPLTIIMTPEQQPFFAGTYFPKYRRYGQPGLMGILEQVAQLWQRERGSLLQTSQEITAAVMHGEINRSREPEAALLDKAYRIYQRQFDAVWGGFGAAPKFPAPHNLLFLMRYGQQAQEPQGLVMAEATLYAMARGGLQDHIGGGFSRYSTDDYWLVPHFEKMLYDNALLLLAYLQAYQRTHKDDYAVVSHRTAKYILRELTDCQGGFYCGQDADSDGVEGKYYVFTPQEVVAVLGTEDGQIFNQRYGITEEGNFEGRSIPNRIGQLAEEWPLDDERLRKLYAYRLRRATLHKDDKVLLSWNSWAIMALAQAGRVLDEPRYLQAAVKAQQFIEANMIDGQNRLYLRWRDGEAGNAAQLDDYAGYALALLELYHATFAPVYLQQAIWRAQQMVDLFADRQNGGYFLTAHDAEKLIVRPKETYDGAMPSGNSVAAMVLQRLAALSGEVQWQQAADKQMAFLAGEADYYPAGHSFALLAMADGLYPHRELVCASRAGVPQELEQYLREHPADGLAVLVKTPGNAEALAVCAPFTAEYAIPEQGAMYYLCQNGACQAPVTEFARLRL